MSFTPTEIAAETKAHSDFTSYVRPISVKNCRQLVLASIDDSRAREDWGWNHHFYPRQYDGDMLEHLK